MLVRHKGLTDNGAGFYDYAADHNLLPPKASAERKRSNDQNLWMSLGEAA